MQLWARTTWWTASPNSCSGDGGEGGSQACETASPKSSRKRGPRAPNSALGVKKRSTCKAPGSRKTW